MNFQDEADLSKLQPKKEMSPSQSCWSKFVNTSTSIFASKKSSKSELKNQFGSKSIRKRFDSTIRICQDKSSHSGPQDPSETQGDEVDGQNETINVRKLRRVIEKLENKRNPLNLFGSRKGKNEKCRKERQKIVLDELEAGCAKPGFISFEEYKEFNNGTRFWDKDTWGKDSEEAKIVKYMKRIGVALKLVHWPPPFFIISLTILQMIFFVLSDQVENVQDYLQFDT